MKKKLNKLKIIGAITTIVLTLGIGSVLVLGLVGTDDAIDQDIVDIVVPEHIPTITPEDDQTNPCPTPENPDSLPDGFLPEIGLTPNPEEDNDFTNPNLPTDEGFLNPNLPTDEGFLNPNLPTDEDFLNPNLPEKEEDLSQDTSIGTVVSANCNLKVVINVKHYGSYALVDVVDFHAFSNGTTYRIYTYYVNDEYTLNNIENGGVIFAEITEFEEAVIIPVIRMLSNKEVIDNNLHKQEVELEIISVNIDKENGIVLATVKDASGIVYSNVRWDNYMNEKENRGADLFIREGYDSPFYRAGSDSVRAKEFKRIINVIMLLDVDRLGYEFSENDIYFTIDETTPYYDTYYVQLESVNGFTSPYYQWFHYVNFKTVNGGEATYYVHDTWNQSVIVNAEGLQWYVIEDNHARLLGHGEAVSLGLK